MNYKKKNIKASVTLANELYRRLSVKKEYGVKIEHRDIGKDALRGKWREGGMSFQVR